MTPCGLWFVLLDEVGTLSISPGKEELRIPRKPRKIGVWVSGAEIQASAVDTRTAVWVSLLACERRRKLFT